MRNLFLLPLFIVNFPASAQQAPDGKNPAFSDSINLPAEELTEVVIIDQQTGLSQKTPFNISSLSMSGITEKSSPSGIMGLLKKQPGVYGAEFGQGIVKPFIRGLGFSRVVTIYQGNKLENHQWGADHGLGVNDLGIGKISVIKGPASVLYGSGALGGVILTEDDDSYLFKEQLTGSIGSSYNSNSQGYRLFSSVGKHYNSGFFIASDLAYESHADYKDGNKRLIGNSRFNVKTLRIHSGWEKENFQNKVSFTYNDQRLGIIIDEEMDEEASLTTGVWDRDMQLPFQKVEDYLLSYQQYTQGRIFDTYLHLSHHLNKRKEIEQDFDLLDLGLQQNHSFFNARVSFSEKVLKHSLGIQGSLIQTENYEEAQEILLPDAKTLDAGLYYTLTADLKSVFLQAALRYDYREVTADASSRRLIDYGFELPGKPVNRKLTRRFDGFTGSLGLSKSLAEDHQLKLNFSTGFRAPDLAELFSNGPHPGTSRFEKGNDAFKREQSLQLDASYTYSSSRFNGNLSFFGTRFDNYIFFTATGQVRQQDDLEIWEYQQLDAFFHGLEIVLDHSWLPDNRLQTKLSASLIRAEDRNTSDNINSIPPDNATIELAYYPQKQKSLRLFSELQLVNEQNRTGIFEDPTPGYSLLNFGISKHFYFDSTSLHFGTTLKNALNKVYVDHLSILRPFEVSSPGRSFLVSLKYQF